MIHLDRAERRAPPGVRRIPGVQPPRGIEQEYYRAVRGYVRSAREAVKAIVIPALDQVFLPKRHDDISPVAGDVIRTAMGRVRFLLTHTSGAHTVAQGVAKDVAAHNERRSKRLVQSVRPIDVVQSDPWLSPMIDNFAELNAALIRSIPETALAEVEKLVRQATMRGDRLEGLAEELLERFDVGESKAQFLARDQVSKLNGSITKARHEHLGITAYIWRGALDERERPEHRRLEGKICQWDDAPSVGHGRNCHPGEDYQCRCWPEPVLPGDDDE